MVVVLTIISRKLYIAMWFNTGTEGLNLLHHHTIRDNGIQTDKEIQNPVSGHKTTAYALNLFVIRK